MTEETEETQTRGRLFLVTAATQDVAAAVAKEIGRRLPRSFVVSGALVDAMVVSGRAADDADHADHADDADDAEDAGLEGVRHRLLRWSACLAAAEAYQLEGFDAVVHDVVTGGHLEDFLDLAAPETVHVVVLDDPLISATPRWGLWLDATAPPGNVADAVLSHLDTARVPTVEPDDASTSPD